MHSERRGATRVSRNSGLPVRVSTGRTPHPSESLKPLSVFLYLRLVTFCDRGDEKRRADDSRKRRGLGLSEWKRKRKHTEGFPVDPTHTFSPTSTCRQGDPNVVL